MASVFPFHSSLSSRLQTYTRFSPFSRMHPRSTLDNSTHGSDFIKLHQRLRLLQLQPRGCFPLRHYFAHDVSTLHPRHLFPRLRSHRCQQRSRFSQLPTRGWFSIHRRLCYFLPLFSILHHHHHLTFLISFSQSNLSLFDFIFRDLQGRVI